MLIYHMHDPINHISEVDVQWLNFLELYFNSPPVKFYVSAHASVCNSDHSTVSTTFSVRENVVANVFSTIKKIPFGHILLRR